MGGNPQMQNHGDSGRKGLIIAISIVSVLLLALGGFIAYKLLIEKPDAEKTMAAVSDSQQTDSLKTAANDTLKTASQANKDEGDDSGKGEEEPKLTDAQALGFAKDVKEVNFGFESAYGYTYRFDRNGQLTTVEFYDHGNEGKMTILNGRAIKCDGEDMGFGDEGPEEPETYHTVYEYREQGRTANVYMSVDGQKEELLGTITYGDDGRIVRTVNGSQVFRFHYDDDGHAYDQSGHEAYPPLAIFLSETPLLPKTHKVKKKDAKGRTLEASSHNNSQFYSINYW